MSAIPQVTKTGPKTYTPAELVLGGQLVEGRPGGLIGVAAAGSTKVLGVALTDAIPPASLATTPATDSYGRPVLNAAPLPTSTAVAYAGIEVPVTYSAAAELGDRLVATAGGKVAPAAADADARTLVGVCTQVAGVAANATGLMRTL
ncbi:hypothetical protein [Rhodococcus pyridinivorans]|uniref:hypothetical protein n=1 Tax=Rhodococcus pyridinivorans TaxID=103816 RepID=UPI000BA1E28F|nr:hypothetical protein [Rhodococcus pyridinivorans]